MTFPPSFLILCSPIHPYPLGRQRQVDHDTEEGSDLWKDAQAQACLPTWLKVMKEFLVCKFYCQEFASGGRQWMKFNCFQFALHVFQTQWAVDAVYELVHEPTTAAPTSLDTKRRPNTQWASLRTRRWFHWTWTYIFQRDRLATGASSLVCHPSVRCLVYFARTSLGTLRPSSTESYDPRAGICGKVDCWQGGVEPWEVNSEGNAKPINWLGFDLAIPSWW